MAELRGESDIEAALTQVGELLDAGGEAYAIVILGGAALNLLGVVARTTTDVDILAVARPGDSGIEREISEPPSPCLNHCEGRSGSWQRTWLWRRIG